MIKDVQTFAAMLLILLMSMANVIMILDKSRDEDTHLVEEYVPGNEALNTLLHSWLLGLGEFASDTYSEQNAWTLWIMFFIATFLVQLIFMNLLIAIMSDSFAKLNEEAARQSSTLKAFCQLMEEHDFIINYNTDFQHVRYILQMGGEED